MAIGTKQLAPSELDTFEDQRLVEELRKAKEELFNLRFQAATGQLESHGRLNAVRKEIFGRVSTIEVVAMLTEPGSRARGRR